MLWLELRNTELTARLLEESIDFFLEVDDLQNDQLDRLKWGEERIILAVPAEWSVNEQLADCRRAGFTPDAAMTVDQVLTSYYLAAEGHGIAFIRDSILFYADLTEKLYSYRLDDPLALRTI